MADKKGTTPNTDGNQQLYFGKYKSLEDAERGFNELTSEAAKRAAQNQAYEAQLNASKSMMEKYEQLLSKATASQQSAASSIPSLKDADGDITPDTLESHLGAREARLATQIKQELQDTLGQLLGPVTTSNEARSRFFAKPDVDDRFGSEMERFLYRNPNLNKAYQQLAGNAETADGAIEMVYKVWKAESAPDNSAVNQEEKRAATGLPEKPGNPMALPGEGRNKKSLMEMGLAASQNPNQRAKTDYMKEFIKGTGLEKKFNQMKSYAEAMGVDMSDE